jgi:hypothetical protein
VNDLPHRLLQPGTLVAVRNRFDGTFSTGFEVASCHTPDATTAVYEVRRISDGVTLPTVFQGDDITPDAPRSIP